MRTPRPSQSLRKLPRRLVPLAVTTALVVSGGLLAAPATASGAPRTAPTTASAPASGTADELEPARRTWSQPLNEVWKHVESTYPNLYGFRNYGWDQVMANRGCINYCVRWDSDAPVTAALRDQIHAALKQPVRKWMARDTAGPQRLAVPNVPVKVVGWAVQDRATLQWTDNSVDIYANNIDARTPRSARPTAAGSSTRTATTRSCPGGASRHYDLSLWLTKGLQRRRRRRLGPAHRQRVLRRTPSTPENIHILLHEIGHTFGLDDFYDWTPTGQCCFLMKAGSATRSPSSTRGCSATSGGT